MSMACPAKDAWWHGRVLSLDSEGITSLPCVELGVQQSVLILGRVHPCLELSEGALKLIRLRSTLQCHATSIEGSRPQEQGLHADMAHEGRAGDDHTQACQYDVE